MVTSTDAVELTVDDAISLADQSRFVGATTQAVVATLAAEVRRLREELTTNQQRYDASLDEVITEYTRDRVSLREASAVTAVNFGKAQLEIAKLQTELLKLRDEHHDLLVRLRLEAPKSDIPYNGY